MSPGPDSRSDRPIFVLGCPRSGTTLLRLMLHSHARIAIPSETKFVIPAWTQRYEFGDLEDSENRRALAEWITGEPATGFHTLGLDAGEVAEEIVAGPPTLGSAIGIVFRAYARRHGKPRWGDKRPSYFRHVGTLLRMFPDAQFVHLVRDGRDCVASLLEMPWYDQDVHHAISAWREAIDQGRRLTERLGPDSYYEIQYERLVTDPADELTRLCTFLGEDVDPAMTRPDSVAKETVPARKRWHGRTRDAVTTDRIGSWAERLEPWQISLAEAAFGERLAEYGYEPSGLPKPSTSQLARFARVSTHRRMAQHKALLRERWERHHEPNPVECLLTSEPTVTPAPPTDTQPTDPHTVGAPAAGAHAAGTEAAGAQATGTQIAGTQIAGAQAAGTQIAGAQAVGTQAAGAEAVGTQAADAEAVEPQPVHEQPVDEQSVVSSTSGTAAS